MIAQIQIDQSELREAIATNNKRLEMLTETIENAVKRLEKFQDNRSPVRSPSASGCKLAIIPELVEVILLHLPIRDLLLAQGVSRTFKAVIGNSQPIQRRLFLLAEPEPSGLRETDVRINPLLADDKSFISIPLYRTKDTTTSFHPIFVVGSPWNSRKLRIAKCDVMAMKDFPSGKATCAAHINLARLPGTLCYGMVDKVSKSIRGSWRRMYLTQPPLRIVYHYEESLGQGIGLQGGRTFGNNFPWEVRRTRLDAAGEDLNGPSDGSEIDASPSEYEL